MWCHFNQRTTSAKKNNEFIWRRKHDLYLHDYKLTVQIHEIGHGIRNIDCKTKRQKAIEKELGCKFIRIDLDNEDFDIFRGINKIFRRIK